MPITKLEEYVGVKKLVKTTPHTYKATWNLNKDVCQNRRRRKSGAEDVADVRPVLPRTSETRRESSRGLNPPGGAGGDNYGTNNLEKISFLKNLLGLHRCHFEPRNGTQKQATDYCKKGEQTHAEWILHGAEGPNWGLNAKFVQFGNLGGDQGKRVDRQQMFNLLKEGKSDWEMAEIDFASWARNYRAIDRLRNSVRPVRAEPRKLILLYGKPGCGKTRFAYEHFPLLYEVPVSKDMWFDGYSGNTVALFDEFEGQMPLNSALKILDGYYVRQVPIKGGFVWWNPDCIIVTSNDHPSAWYDYTTRAIKEDALRRRFIDFGEVYDNMVKVPNIKTWWPIKSDGIAIQTLDNNYLSGK